MAYKYKFNIDEQSAIKCLPDTNSAQIVVSKKYFLSDFSEKVFDSLYSYSLLSLSPKAAKLHQIESRLRMSRAEILGILSEAGYVVPNKANYTLTYEHLYIIAKAYEKSIKNLFKRVKKRAHALSADLLKEKAGLFATFIENSHKFKDIELFEQELSSDLINNWVINLAVEEIDERTFDKSFYNFLRKLKFNIKRLYRDIRIQLLSIILSHHYHVFPSEEDSAEKLNYVKSFSVSLNSWTRKAIVELNPIKAFYNERHTNFNTTYKRLQFI